MLSDFDLAQLCFNSYWKHDDFDYILDPDGVWAGLKLYPDCSAVVFRGSTTILDWARDFQGEMVEDDELGGVEAGFIQGLHDIDTAMMSLIPRKPLYITGHSLGAARAFLFAGLWQYVLNDVDTVVTFGSPRPGAERLKTILEPVQIRSYRNRSDPVCAVPFDIPLFAPYVHPKGLIPVDIAPERDDPWGLLSDHHIELYLEAMKHVATFTPVTH